MVKSTCSSWFRVSRGGENRSFATSKLGKVVSVKKIKVFCVCSLFRVSDFVSVLISFVGLVQLTSLKEILYRK